MSFCAQCGHEIADGVKFCPECGKGIDAPTPAQQADPTPAPQTIEPQKKGKKAKKDKPEKKGGKGKVIAIIVAVIIVIGMIGSCGSEDTESPDTQDATQEQTTNTDTSVTPDPEPEPVVVVDKSALETEISEVSALDGSTYTEESFAALTAAIDAAKAVVADEDATQDEVDAALDAINDANAALEVPFNPADYESVSYKDIARNPDSYIGKMVVFSGNVLQVMESDTEIDLRVATDGGYDDVVLAAYSSDLLDFRVLEDDQIKFYGMCLGLYTYTSTLGAEISIPAVYCDEVVLL